MFMSDVDLSDLEKEIDFEEEYHAKKEKKKSEDNGFGEYIKSDVPSPIELQISHQEEYDGFVERIFTFNKRRLNDFSNGFTSI